MVRLDAVPGAVAAPAGAADRMAAGWRPPGTGAAAALGAVLDANFPALGVGAVMDGGGSGAGTPAAGASAPAAPAAAALAAALPHCRVRRLAAGATLFAQGSVNALYAVLEGEVAMRFSTADGSASMVELAPPPRLFGLAALASGQPSSYEAIAHRAARVLVIGEPAYVALMDGLPGFGRALMREFAHRHDRTLHLLQASRLQSAAGRLALALHQLVRAGRAAPAAADGRVLLRTTQAELALLAGLSRQTVNETLARLARAGHLSTGYGGVRLQAASAASMSLASFSGASWGA